MTLLFLPAVLVNHPLTACARATLNIKNGQLELGDSVLLQMGSLYADVALLPLGTLAHALTNDDALSWLIAARNALLPGGILVLELAHPADVFDGAFIEVKSQATLLFSSRRTPADSDSPASAFPAGGYHLIWGRNYDVQELNLACMVQTFCAAMSFVTHMVVCLQKCHGSTRHCRGLNLPVPE